MPKTFKQALAAQQDDAAEKALAIITQEHSIESMKRAAKVLGGITAIGVIARNLNAHALRGLQTLEQENLYKPLGYDTFVDFLHSDESPLSKSQYYERIKVLENEGDVLFDTLNGMSLPISKRKLLGKGNVEVRSDEVIVTTADENGDETQTFIPLADRNRLLDTLTLLADTANDLRRKTDKLTKKVEQGQKDYDELRRQADAGEALPAAKHLSAHSDALMTLIGAMQRLITAAAKIPAADKGRVASETLPEIAAQIERLREAYTPNGEADPQTLTPNPQPAAAKLSGEELGELFD